MMSMPATVGLADDCPREWTPGWTRTGIDREIVAMTTLDLDGPGPAGPSLILAGAFFSIDGVVAPSPVAWDGQQLTSMNAGLSYGAAIRTLTALDLDGPGPLPTELYAIGDFYFSDGLHQGGLARWTRSAGGTSDRWMPIGGPTQFDLGYILAIAAHDFDGSGPDAPRLIAVSDSNPANGSIQQWNGAAWSAVGVNNHFNVSGIVSVDHDGAGPNPPVLYVRAGNTGVMRLQGDSWVSVPGVSGTFDSIASFDLDGLGPQGQRLVGVNSSGVRIGSSAASHMAVGYDGQNWQPLGSLRGSFNSPALLSVVAGPLPNSPPSMLLALQGWPTNQIFSWGAGGSGAGDWQLIAYTPTNVSFSPGAFRGLALFDRDGLAPGPAELIVGGGFRFTNGARVEYLATARGSVWKPLTDFSAVPDGTVLSLKAFDADGDGPLAEKLFVGGSFSTVRGVTMPALATWDGRAWVTVGSLAANPAAALRVGAMETYDDDGPGPRPPGLYVGGFFNTIGGATVGHIARLDASGWSTLGAGFSSTTSTSTAGVTAMLVVDLDGPGPQRESLLVAGAFDNVGGLPLGRIAAWNGQRWTPMGNGAPNAVIGLAAFPRTNNTPQLLAVTSGGSLAIWNGAFWQATPFVFGQRASFARMCDDDGAGPNPPALLVGGQFESVMGVPTLQGLARYDGNAWSAVNVTDQYCTAEAASTLDLDGPGPEPARLVLAGTFSNRVGGTSALAVQQGSGAAATFELLGGYMYPPETYAIEALTDEPGRPPSLYIAGLVTGVDRFAESGGLAAGGLARFGCLPCISFTAQPMGRTIRAGSPFSLTAQPLIDGFGATYQWRHDGVPLMNGNGVSGATSLSLNIAGMRAADAGIYDLLVTASCGSTPSAAAIVTVSCDADFDGDGVVGVGDIFAYIPAFLLGQIEADFGRDFHVSVQDLFDFLHAYFQGC
jgi:hypothetical protein